MQRYTFDSTNPLIFFVLMASALLFVLLSMVAFFLLGFLALLFFAELDPTNPYQVGAIFIVFGMACIAVWNIVDSIKLMDEMNVRRLGFVVIRSLIALIPVGLIALMSLLP